MKNLKTLTLLLVFTLTIACNNENEECSYTQPCEPYCDLFEDFEDKELGTFGNWQGLAIDDIQFQTFGASKTLYVEDGSGASWAYNAVDFPKKLLEQGCALNYDTAYLAGSSNSSTTDNGIVIYKGTSPAASTSRATFKLNLASLITSGDPLTTIEVPLELATGTTLPSNSYGEWVLSGIPSPYSAADIITFNTLIQDIDGVAFFIDEGGNPAEKWWFDNFCFQQCCPDSTI
ncbi:hypothetical protein SAMN05444411_10725 [Lutibacter oricola]|uniref:Uncharacterized protein n=1 Tax=Lutibacter oricola TaxID=762486 RepID=A0A1H3D1J4_9FLAO|nr:hypothetical protein [Lutibacter oricola]SDX60206.1 hypothetical protein SAMN05444411_10725 [Lutibacter oricola]